MKARGFLFAAFLALLTLNGYGQGFTAPTKGKAVVYFVRVAAFQYSVPFTFFDGKSLIADFPSRHYFRYECEPGQHLFWASCDNKEFLPADLQPDKTYVVIAEALQGSGLPKVALVPVNTKHKDFHKAKHMIFNRPPLEEDPDTIKAENERMRGFIEKSVTEYQAANAKPELRLTADLAIPTEKIK